MFEFDQMLGGVEEGILSEQAVAYFKFGATSVFSWAVMGFVFPF